jgi:molybdopterin molybdotransferase
MSDLPDYPEALARALDGIAPRTERLERDLADAAGGVLVEPVVADRDLPPFDRAQMDGYAVRAGEVGRVEAFGVAGSIAAGEPPSLHIGPGQCAAIATGAPVPADLDAVVPHELSDRGDPIRFSIGSLEPGHAVHPRGADARRGEVLVEAGTLLGPQHLGIAATVGLERLAVARPPRARLLTSGDEVRAAGEPVADHQIRNSNAPMIQTLLRRIGAEPAGHAHVPDERETTVSAVGDALGDADLLITVGGVSAGERDWFPAAFDAAGVTVSLHGAAIQPGRPILIGRSDTAIVVALPGNPVSCLACTCLFVWPVVRALLGLDPALPWRAVELTEPVKPNPKRRAFRPAVLVGERGACVPAWAGSGDLAHTAPTDGLLELPVQAEAVAAGTTLRFLQWP